MRSILKKLHIGPGQSDDADGPPSASPSSSRGDQKPLSGFSGWLSSIASRSSSPSPPPSAASSSCSALSASGGERRERQGGQVAREAVGRRDFDMGVSRAPEMDEEYQIQLALELSAREDPEAVQIEAVKQISLGSCPTQDTPAEVIAYRYWNYNALGYEDKVLDGFYDLYGVLAESTLVKMPSLVDLQGVPVTDNISWVAVLVNRAGDSDLVKLEQRALVMTLESKSESLGFPSNDLVRKLALLVADYMGGAVCEPDSMLKLWRNLSNHLRETIGNMVLPLGRLTFGLARHRALLFKVLADSVGIPCRLVKGQQFTGSDDGAVNIVKFNDGREFIVDLMADPGTLIPSDSASSANEFEDDFFVTHPFIGDADKFHVASSCSGASSSTNYSEIGCKLSISRNISTLDTSGATLSDSEIQKNQNLSTSQHDCCTCGSSTSDEGLVQTHEPLSRPSYPYTLARSPSWTEGISSPAVHRMKVNDVSQYMIDAAKENPQLAQKLHDVLLESGVVAPPNLFTEIYTEQREKMVAEDMKTSEVLDETKKNVTGDKIQTIVNSDPNFPNGPLNRQLQRRVVPSRPQLDPFKPVERLGLHQPSCFREASGDSCSSVSEVAAEETLQQFIKHMPVAAAAAAAATAAVVASSMVVAAAKSNTEINMEVPVAAAVVATTASVSRQYENLESGLPLASLSGSPNKSNIAEKNEECYAANAQLGGDHGHDSGREQEQVSSGMHPEMERNSDKSTGNESAKSDITLDDVAELEIPWEDIILGERIGLGSFGEVYRADWHGTEVAVKRFLHQDILGDALEEFISEVRLMKRLRHPNVVLFMGAVTRVPNLSIVTEFLPRGSLFRLIHRSNSQLDERRRLRMALDVARGMNYLHNCNPVVVHRDLKSPNLLVDKNWVVKVCDFGLSRMKYSTFLSSRSTAGTAEWMAPEVLRNEPSDEKCDVFSFGVILWELCTLQQPWEGMNAMQVVGAVGFQQRRLDIPNDTDPVVADIIAKCWQTDPKARPSFSDIMAALKLLQKPLSNVQVPKQRVRTSVKPEKGTS